MSRRRPSVRDGVRAACASALASTLCLAAPGLAHAQCAVQPLDKIIDDAPGPGEEFGRSVALEGTLAVVGSPGSLGGAGSARVYVAGPDGSWTPGPTLTDPIGAPGDAFGTAVAVSGVRVAVSSPGSGRAAPNAGAVLVYRMGLGRLGRIEARLEDVVTAPDAEPGAAFGHAVALSGSLLAVGSPQADGFEPESGAAYVYGAVAEDEWQLLDKLSDALALDELGASVDLEAGAAIDSILIGAPGAAAGAGAAYSYIDQGGGWTLDEVVQIPTPNPGDRFGEAVAQSEGLMLVGAPGRGVVEEGAAFTLVRSPDSDGTVFAWSLSQTIVAPAAGPVDRFGASVDLDLALAGVGAEGASGLTVDSGLAYLLPRDGSSLGPPQPADAPDAVAGGRFGADVAVGGGVALVGAPGATANLQTGAGAAYALGVDCPRPCPVDPTTCLFWIGATGGPLFDGINWDAGAPPQIGETGVFDDVAGPVPLDPAYGVLGSLVADRVVLRSGDVSLDLQQSVVELLAQPIAGQPASLVIDPYTGAPASLSVLTSSPGPPVSLNARSGSVGARALSEASLSVEGADVAAHFSGRLSIAERGVGSLSASGGARLSVDDPGGSGEDGFELASVSGIGSLTLRNGGFLQTGSPGAALGAVVLGGRDGQAARGVADVSIDGSASSWDAVAGSIRLAVGGQATVRLTNQGLWSTQSPAPVDAGVGRGALFTLRVGAGSAWFHTGSEVRLGDGHAHALALLDAGSHITAPAVRVGDESVLRGEGSVDAVVSNNGVVDPAALLGGEVVGTGTLTIGGAYSQAPVGADSGELRLRIAGDQPADRDALDVAGVATLDGGLIARFAPGFQPTTPEALDGATLLTASAVTGRFLVAQLPRVEAPRSYYVEYQAARAVLRIAGLPALGVELDLPISGDSGLASFVRDVALGDLDGDGLDDAVLVLADPNHPLDADGAVAILYSSVGPDGAFEGFQQPAQLITANTGANPSAVALADFDNNGRLDIAVANRGAPSDGVVGSISFILNGSPPGAAFQIGQLSESTVGEEPTDVAAGDFNHDGLDDLIVVNHGSDSVSLLLNRGASRGPTLRGGMWMEMEPPDDTELEPGCDPLGVQPGEIQGGFILARAAGALDAAVTANGGKAVIVLVNDGQGGLTPLPPIEVGDDPNEITGGDFDGDGRFDLATSNGRGGTVSILLNRGQLSGVDFAPRVDLPIGDDDSTNPGSITSGDYDGDGDTDLAVVAGGDDGANGPTRVVRILRNDTLFGDLAFATATENPVQPSTTLVPLVVRTGDVNGDGQDDLATGNVDASGDASGGTGDATAFGTRPHCPGDVNGDGKTDVFDFAELAAHFGSTVPPYLDGDLDGDGDVDVFDFADLTADFGCDATNGVPNPPPPD